MSLFVGNISKSASLGDLEDEFKKFGQCNFRNKGNFAFVEFDNENEAEDALDALNKKEFSGQNLNIEWSKKSNRYDHSKSSRPPSRKEKERCHNCDEVGHYARECRTRRRRSRSRSNDRRDRDRGRDFGRRDQRDRRDRRSRSPHDRDRRRNSRSRSRSPKRRYRDDRRTDDRRRDYGRDRDRRRDTRDDRDNNRVERDNRRRGYSQSQSQERGRRSSPSGGSPKRGMMDNSSQQKLEKHVSSPNNQRDNPEHQGESFDQRRD